ncbi:MAG TPA: YcxB family protein [Candidatus Angelobacter sp.]|jgi:hypothetical protein|nr:YcxB family protein [Candidatus Angelobacter sp.]
MHIDYSISEQDYALAQQLAWKTLKPISRAFFLYAGPIFAIGLLVFWIHALVARGFSSNLAPGIAVPVLFLYLPFAVRSNTRKMYGRSGNLHGPLSLDVAEEKLHFSGASFSSDVTWSHFTRFAEDQHSFVLFQSPGIFNMIPKRHLTPEQADFLRTLLQSHLSAGSRPFSQSTN